MKTKYVRIYPEEELRHKVQRTTALIKQIEEFHFSDIQELKDLWVQYESTRYIVSESMLLKERYIVEAPENLFVERTVDDDYSDDFQDPDSLHNGLVTMQFLYEGLLRFISHNAQEIQPEQYQDPFRLVVEIAADIYLHLDPPETNEWTKMEEILNWLNYLYIYGPYNDDNFVEMTDVMACAEDKEFDEHNILQQLIYSLDLVEE